MSRDTDDDGMHELRATAQSLDALEGFTGRDEGAAEAHLQLTRLMVIKLEEALRPFAECALQIPAEESNEEWAKFRLLVKDYRRAAHVLGLKRTSASQSALAPPEVLPKGDD